METLSPADWATRVFNVGIPFEGPLDVAYFCNIPNADSARKAISFLANQTNEIELHKRHSEADIQTMWKAAFRGCVKHGVPVPGDLIGYAKRLGVYIP